MLVLSRKLNETIVIGENVHIKVVGINGNQVRLGIEAPGHIKIMREELLVRDESDVLTDPSQRLERRRRLVAVDARR